MSTDYSSIEIGRITRIQVDDGWFDGADVSVYFDGRCGRASNAHPCAEGTRLVMAYQRVDGKWSVFHSELLPSDP
jgi:hypothetical protein